MQASDDPAATPRRRSRRRERLTVRWQPDSARCPECGYYWAQPVDEAIADVSHLPGDIERSVDLRAPGVRRPAAPGTWSQGAYVWHLVDVLGIGTERLWTIADDPSEGLRCWDENALADVRQYERQSPVVAYVRCAPPWTAGSRRRGRPIPTRRPSMRATAP